MKKILEERNILDADGVTHLLTVRLRKSDDGKFFLELRHRGSEQRALETSKLLGFSATNWTDEPVARQAFSDAIDRALTLGMKVAQVEPTVIHLHSEFDRHRQDGFSKFTITGEDSKDPKKQLSLVQDLIEKTKSVFLKPAEEGATSIRAATAEGRHADAYRCFQQAKEAGVFGFPVHRPFFDALLTLDITALEDAAALEVLTARVHLGSILNELIKIEPDIQRYEKIRKGAIPSELQQSFLRIKATIAQRKGQREKAYNLFKELLRNNNLIALERGCAHRGIAQLQDDKEEAKCEFERAADAFLEAGERWGAAACYLRIANLSLASEPEAGLKLIDKALSWFQLESLSDKNLKAGLFHSRAELLSALGRTNLAYSDALQAVELRRELIGAEAQRKASIKLAMFLGADLGQPTDLSSLKAELAEVEEIDNDPHSVRRERIAAILENSPVEDLEALLRDIEHQGDDDERFLWYLLMAIRDTSDLGQSISYLEQAQEILNSSDLSNRIAAHRNEWLATAYAQLYLKHKDERKAFEWTSKAFSLNPLNLQMRQNLLAFLFKKKQWREVIDITEKQMRIFGELPGMLFACGRAHLELGEYGQAIKRLHQAQEASQRAEFRTMVKPFFDRALSHATGNEIAASTAKTSSVLPIGTREFERCLDTFIEFVKTSKRMEFWEREGSRHKWISNPERRAQSILHTFIKAQLGEGVEVLEEIASGAGRIDLYVRLADLTKIVIELKMCGAPYTKNYARGGIDQLVHYMENKGTCLGYLIVFDARKRDFKKDLPDTELSNGRMVYIRTADVRSTIDPTDDSEE